MRTFACLAAASIVAVVPALACAQDAPAAPAPEPPPAATTVVVIPAAPLATPAPVWFGTPTPDPVAMRRRNPKLMVGGIVMMPLGLAMAIGGGVWAANINSQPSGCEPQQGDGTIGGAIGAGIGDALCGIADGIGRGMSLTAAYTLAVMGGAMVFGGAVMTGVGGSMVPATKPQWQPAVSVGAGSAKLTWTF
jgi:hypothetical protein